MDNRFWKLTVIVVVIGMAMAACAVAGGGLVYALIRGTDILPVARAQEVVDPGYGLVIAAVAPGGPAEEAGVVRGDILLEIEGEILESAGDLYAVLEDLEPGGEVALAILHGDAQSSLQATLGQRMGDAYLGVSLCAAPAIEWSIDTFSTGARVVEVLPDTPAQVAGLQAGDVILSVDSQDVDQEHTLADLIGQYRPGDQITLSVSRQGEEDRLMEVELVAHPDDPETAYLGIRYSLSRDSRIPEDWHFPLEEFDFDLDLDDLEFSRPDADVQRGARIEEVVGESPAFEAGLAEGDVITAVEGDSVNGPLALSDAVTTQKPGDEVTLTILDPDSGQEREITVTLGVHPDKEETAYLGVRTSFYVRVEGLEELELPFGFQGDRNLRFHFMPPFEDSPWHELPFDLEEFLRDFEYHWPPETDDGGDCDGSAGVSA